MLKRFCDVCGVPVPELTDGKLLAKYRPKGASDRLKEVRGHVEVKAILYGEMTHDDCKQSRDVCGDCVQKFAQHLFFAEGTPDPEMLADIAHHAGHVGHYSGDSRADMQQYIAWANEFKLLHKDTDWEEHGDYIGEIEKFCEEKMPKHKWDVNVSVHLVGRYTARQADIAPSDIRTHEYQIEAACEHAACEAALSIFHGTVAIGCLECVEVRTSAIVIGPPKG